MSIYTKIAISLASIILFIGLLTVSACSLLTQSSVKPKKTTLVIPDIFTQNLIQHVKQLSVTNHPRNYLHLDNLNATADYIKQHMQSYSHDVSEQIFTIDNIKYRNIISHFGPKKGARIIIGAHYDSCCQTQGADDNASGIAGLLELARLLKENPPNTPIELIAYSLEEPPFFRTNDMGSAIHAQSVAGQPIKLMISLEMIGYFSDKPNSQQFPFKLMQKLYSDKGNFIAIISNMDNRKTTATIKSYMLGATDLPVYSLNAPSFITGVDFSDHRNYWKHDIPAVMITDTSFYRNVHYHEANGDSWEDLDYNRMAKVIQGVYSTVQNY